MSDESGKPQTPKELVAAILVETSADDVDTGWHRGTSNHVVGLVRGLGLKLTTITGYATRLATLLAERDAAVSGINRIASERKRQVEEEGYSIEHDKGHDDDDLACAGAWYALPRGVREEIEKTNTPTSRWIIWPDNWVFSPTPSDRVRELTKAGALIAAEIDRREEEAPHG